MHAPRPRCQEGGEGRSRSAGPKQAGATAQRSTQCNQSGDDETNMLVDIRPLRSDSLGLARLSTIRSSRRSCSGLDPEPGPGIICKSLPYLRSSGSARSKSKESLLASQHVARHSSLHCMPFVLSPRRWAATASSRRRLDQALSWGISSFWFLIVRAFDLQQHRSALHHATLQFQERVQIPCTVHTQSSVAYAYIHTNTRHAEHSLAPSARENQDVHLHFWATSPLADARECATAAKGNLPRDSSAQPHKSEKLHCGYRGSTYRDAWYSTTANVCIHLYSFYCIVHVWPLFCSTGCLLSSTYRFRLSTSLYLLT